MKMTFQEFVEINPRVFLTKGINYPFVPMENISPGNKFPTYINTKIYKGGGAKFQNSDIIFARITPCLENGKIAKIKNLSGTLGFGSTEFFVFRAREGISDSDFIYYLSLTDIIKKTAEKSMTGASGRQRADLDSIKNIEINFPNLPTQYKIASTLSAYDDLIENNTRRIKILEEMAQAIYKEWFVNFRFPGHEKVKFVDSPIGKIPEGWEYRKMGDFITFIKGKKTKRVYEEQTNGLVKLLLLDNISSGDYKFVEFEERVCILENDIVMVMDGASSGKVFIDLSGFLGSTLATVRINNNSLGCYQLFYFFVDKFKNISDNNTGAAIPHANKEYINQLNIVIPSESINKEYNKLANSIHSQIQILKSKNYNLRKTRDLLLPKLMSGEVEL